MLHSLAVLCLVLLTGNEICVAAFVEPVLRGLPEGIQVQAVPGIAGRLGRVMPFWYALSLLLTAIDLWIAHRRQDVWVGGRLCALVLQLVVLAGTLALLVPLNTRLARMREVYGGWLADARRWDRLHQIRVLLLVAASFALVFWEPYTL